MITFEHAQELAMKETHDLVVTNAVKFRDYYVFFMQPKGVDPESEDALFDSYVFVNYKSGKIEYKSILMFHDFADEAIPM